ncbi:type VI secretion protein [Candidatus Magnetomorum sp. HK-1]|nr:type VI secretion protein [Candidatus Magnetomorum sp. HK-1]
MNKRNALFLPHAYYHLLWAIHLLSKKIDLSRLRFYVKPGMGIRVPEIDSIKASDSESSLYEVWTHFGGIDGISGPLPLWLNDMLARENAETKGTDDEKTPLGDFINIFSHRFTYLLYKAWLKNKAFLLFNQQGKDSISQILLSLMGLLDIEDKKDNASNERIRLLSYVGSLGHRPRSAASLVGMLRHFFKDIPINIKMFMKRFIDVPEKNQARIGRYLQGNIILGRQMTDISSAFRIIVGPLAKQDYELFLPGNHYNKELINLISTYSSKLMEWDIELRLDSNEIPAFKIGKEYSARLGHNTWFPSSKKQEGVIFLSVNQHMN